MGQKGVANSLLQRPDDVSEGLKDSYHLGILTRHTKLDRENRFQTSRLQSKPKPKQNNQ
jgi:hypothetical protein